LLKESSIFNNYFIDYARFASIPKGKLNTKFTMPHIKFYGTEDPPSYEEFGQCHDFKMH